MSTVEETTETTTDPSEAAWEEPAQDGVIALEVTLAEAEALRAWLLKPAADGTNSLDDPLVSRVLSRVGIEVDCARSAANVRRELASAGVSVEHLTDDQLRDLGCRIADATAAVPRA
jgi:hypothetical protein